MARKPLFTPEELEELARINAELEAAPVSNEEIAEVNRRDRSAKLAAKDEKSRKVAERQRRYYEANKDKRRLYMREYMRKRRAQETGCQCAE